MIEDYVADLDAIVGKVSQDKPLRIVGHSMGGNIASLCASVRAERVKRRGLWVAGT